MQKKIYVGGLPWELDRIGLLNYLKAVLEGAEMTAGYELPFISEVINQPNAAIKVIDIFVANDRNTGKSRGFGFITLELAEETADQLFDKVMGLLREKVVIGIRGPRKLIVNLADPKQGEGAPARTNGTEDKQEIEW